MRAEQLIREDRPEESDRYLQLVVQRRKDPSPQNDALRRRLILAAKGGNASRFLQARMAEVGRNKGYSTIETNLSFSSKGRMG